jgi:hypothetical protein
MKIADIASEVYQELGSPTDFSVPVVSYWLRANIGLLNSAINTGFYINPASLEIEQLNSNSSAVEIDEDEKCILKLMFIVHFYDVQIRKNMLNYSLRPIVELTSDGHTIRVASQTEIGKNLYMFRKGLADELKQYISWYKISRAYAVQVSGDDVIQGAVASRPIYRRVYSIYDVMGQLSGANDNQ